VDHGLFGPSTEILRVFAISLLVRFIFKSDIKRKSL
jgi:hypothetical protein